MVAGRLFRLDQRYPAVRRKRGCHRGAGNAGTDHHHLELINVHANFIWYHPPTPISLLPRLVTVGSMQSRITGTTMPVLEIGLEPGDYWWRRPANSPG